MRIKPGFILRESAGENVAIPFDCEYETCGAILTLNQTAAFLWKQMQNDCTREDLGRALANEYKIDMTLADKAVETFLAELEKENLLECSKDN